MYFTKFEDYYNNFLTEQNNDLDVMLFWYCINDQILFWDYSELIEREFKYLWE